MRVVFLDYDGVVNTPVWDDDTKCFRFNYPDNNRVNNPRCVQLVSEFCEKYGYSIVVTSTWRFYDNYIDCLKNGGLSSKVEVVGKTPIVSFGTRADEIKIVLAAHPSVTHYLIFDDENDLEDLDDHLVLCDSDRGFSIEEYYKAERLHTILCAHEEDT